MKRVALLPPATDGSLGDQAMMLASISELERQGVQSFHVLAYGKYPYLERMSQGSRSIEQTNILSYYPHAIDKGLDAVAEVSSKCDAFYCLGADVLDGQYSETVSLLTLKIIECAAELLDRVVIQGCSFSEEPSRNCLNALLRLPPKVVLCVRDSNSLSRLPWDLQRRARLVADLAFLLEPQDFNLCCGEMKPWLKKQRLDGRLILGLNLSYPSLRCSGLTALNPLLDVFLDMIVRLADSLSCSFVFIPHDSRGPFSDAALLDTLTQMLPASVAPRCFLLPTDFTAAQVKGVVAELDLVIAGRMHLAIASLGQQTPVACLTYQGKFEGLFKHFHIDGLTLSPTQACHKERLFQFVEQAISRRDDIRRLIATALPTVSELARANFYS